MLWGVIRCVTLDKKVVIVLFQTKKRRAFDCKCNEIFGSGACQF